MAKPKYACPKDVDKAIGQYFKECEEKDVFPDYAGMLLYLKVSRSTVDRWCSEEHADYKIYRGVFEKADLKRESWLNRKPMEEPKTANHCAFLLKQKKNGGYKDRDKNENTETKLTINLVGLGGDAQFKG